MKYSASILICVVLLIFSVSQIAVATSFDYNEGMIDIPTADVLDHLQLKTAYVTSYWDSLEEKSNEDGAKIAIGIMDMVEIGVTGHTWEFWDFSSWDEENNFVANIQAKVIKEQKLVPNIAVGVHNISSDDTVYYKGYKHGKYIRPTIGEQNNSIFAVASKTLLDKGNRIKLMGHFGIGNKRYAFKDDDERIKKDTVDDSVGYPGNKDIGVFGGIEFNYYFYDYVSQYLVSDIITGFGERPWDEEEIISQVESRTGYYLTNDEVFSLKNSTNPVKMLFSVLNKRENLVRLMFEYDAKDYNLGVQYVHEWFEIGFALQDLSGADADEDDYKKEFGEAIGGDIYWLETMKFNMGFALKTYHRNKDVIINDSGENFEEVVEVVANLVGKDHTEVRQMLVSSPVTILRNRPYYEAKFIVNHLTELGASASID